MNFTRKIRQNARRPKDGSEPLTVIEFSLTNEVRDSLEAALSEYAKEATKLQSAKQPEGFEGDWGDYKHYKRNEMLAAVIRDHLPPEILEELSALKQKGESAATVYCIRNLPKEHISQASFAKKNRSLIEAELMRDSLSSTLGKGIGLALGLKPQENIPLIRFANASDQGVPGGSLHKHGNDVSLLAGVVSDGAPTRFTDMAALIDQAGEMVESDIPQVRLEDHRCIKLNQLPEARPHWRSPAEMEINPPDGWSGQDKFNEMVKDNSQDVTLESGNLVVWAEDGRIFHQGMPGTQPLPKETIVARLVKGHAFKR